LHKAENAWKPKLRGKDSKLNDEEAKYEKFRKSVRSLLNKITPTTYAEIVGKFVELNVGQNEHSCKVAVGLIFDKAVEEPTFCGMYTDLCKNQFNVEGGRKEEGSFFYTLVQKVQSTFEGNSEIDKQIKERQSKLTSKLSEKDKAELSNEVTFLQNKEKRRILGNIKFISHLYTAEFFGDSILSSCCGILHQMFLHSKDDLYVQYGIEMLELVAKLYYSQKRREARTFSKTVDNVKMFTRWISTAECKDAVSLRVKVLIMNFEDFVNARRAAKKTGPKTLQQIQDEIRQKDQENLADRHKHERQKKDERMRTKTPPRVLQIKQNLAQKKANAVSASLNAGNSTSNKKFASLKRANKPTEKPSYLSQNKYGRLAMETDENQEDVAVEEPVEQVNS